MTAVLLALCAALAYGVSDFLSGTASRLMHYGRVALVCQSVMAVVTWAAVGFVPGDASMDALLWGALAGVGSGAGTVMLYRGLGSGQMNVVAPLSAATAAVVPVAFGLITGERPSVVILLGVVLIVPGIGLISSVRAQPGGRRRVMKGTVDGTLAGAAFAISYIALDGAPSGAGLWPAAYTQLSALAVIALAAALLIRPANRGHAVADGARRAHVAAVAAGLLGALAVATFLFATDHGLLVVTSVLTSLYPAATVILARVLLAERTSRAQLVGLTLAAAGIILVVVG
ncbi:EamA family transporter [Cumulibacter soli]|uniref:EamA family transporter n=1 Tax=Cumulibacter soli TaxID=2546344 RepID=UPI0010682063|nr:EamA family transporter [Cumulibacter soli]